MITRRLKQLGNAARWLVLAAIALAFCGWPARSVLGSSSSNQEQGESSSKRPDKPLPKDSTVERTPEAEADKDIDIGKFYMRKGDRDAAIGRYQDAADVAPKYAKPRLLLAEAYERAGDKAAAVKYYRQYLQVAPDAPDKDKVLKKIERLAAR